MRAAFATITFLLVTVTIAAQAPVDQFETLLSNIVDAEGPGAAVLVAKNGEVIYRKARGMADVAAKRELSTDHIFRIGSITKQFTAVAILQLVEKEKLSLDDEITKFIPDYPVGGRKITVEQLLNHTSGIMSYTSLPAFDPVTRQKHVTTQELMDFFKDEPFEFEPSTDWNYNNSGYVLLGMIIEKVSGRGYGEYVEVEIFHKLGMRSSSHARDDVQVKGHATGHAKGPDGWAEAEPLSMTWPYSAGALLSTVDDLHTWNAAVMNGKLVGEELMRKALSPTILADGRTINYGYGWFLSDLQGTSSVEHGGGINGFVSMAIHLLEEKVYVAVLTNQESDLADDLAARLAAIAIGKPYTFNEIAMSGEELKQYEGVYADDGGRLRYLRLDGSELTSQRAGGTRLKLRPDARDHFFFMGSLTQITVRRDADEGSPGSPCTTGRSAIRSGPGQIRHFPWRMRR